MHQSQPLSSTAHWPSGDMGGRYWAHSSRVEGDVWPPSLCVEDVGSTWWFHSFLDAERDRVRLWKYVIAIVVIAPHVSDVSIIILRKCVFVRIMALLTQASAASVEINRKR